MLHERNIHQRAHTEYLSWAAHPSCWLSKLAMQHSLLSTIRKKGIIMAAHEAYMRIAYIIDCSDNF